jgi:peptidoglycan/LPS O-acetylase OafA/YrhL
LRERERTGAIHLRAFYIRRALRIWPLYVLGLLLNVVVFRLVGLKVLAFRYHGHS